MFKGKVVALALMLLLATSVFAGDVDDCLSNAGVSCTTMKVTLCPAGDFERIATGCGGAADYIWIEARDAGNLPIPGIPWTDYWLNACDPLQQLCVAVGQIAADSLTGANGRTTFSGRIASGGCVLSQGIWWAIQGKPILAKPCGSDKLCLNVQFKSPDINGAGAKPDCVIDLSDLIPFGGSYNKISPDPLYNACCDYTDDGAVDLSDFAAWGTHYLHVGTH